MSRSDFGEKGRIGFDRVLRFESDLLAERGGDGIELLIDIRFEPGRSLAAGSECQRASRSLLNPRKAFAESAAAFS